MTPAEAATFWHCPESEDPPSEPATDAMIREFNARHGVALPDSFATLYKSQNGGASRLHGDSFWSIDAEIVPLTTLDRLCDGYHDEDVVAAWTELAGELSQIVVYFGDGHFYFALNFNDVDGGEPIVWYFDDNGAKRTGMQFEGWLTSDGGVR